MSVFTDRPATDHVASNEHAFAIRDGYPVSPGHTLVIPRREFASWFDATPQERAAIFELVEQVKAKLDAEFHPDGYNLGINCGAAAGQTVMHLHVHVIPRFLGDVPDPRGGVRHLMPGKGFYPPPVSSGSSSRGSAERPSISSPFPLRNYPLVASPAKRSYLLQNL